MLLIDSLAEEKIRLAQRDGEFDDLPGAGKPLPPDEAMNVPQDLRVAYRVLKNAGCVPEELTLRHEINEVESLLAAAEFDEREDCVRRRLRLLRLRLSLCGRPVNLLVEETVYRERLIARIGPGD